VGVRESTPDAGETRSPDLENDLVETDRGRSILEF
jgi:hypothetical protein